MAMEMKDSVSEVPGKKEPCLWGLRAWKGILDVLFKAVFVVVI